MTSDGFLDLAEYTEFRQAIQARPPRLAHGAVALLVGLVAAGLAWSAVTKADLVVRAPGRVRPLSTPTKVFTAARGQVPSAGTGRVARVCVREGDEVRQGDLLIRLETEQLDNDIAKERRGIRAAEEELAELEQLTAQTARQLEAARAKGAAELAEVLEEVRKAKEQQASDVRQAERVRADALREETQLRRLVQQRAAAPNTLFEATTRLREAEEKLHKARLPVNEKRVQVVREALGLVERDYAVKQTELQLKRTGKQGEVEAARLKLANMELERKQVDIRAPIAGVVTRGDVKVGDILEPGRPAMEVAARAGFVFEAAVPGEDVGHLRVGIPARVKLDPYDYQRYGTLGGVVCFIAPDSSVADGPQTVTYTVRIALDGDEVGRGEAHGQVKLGMNGQVEIVSAQESLLSLLLKRIRQRISLG
jgi:HlyD family type I secretion membrane fusion protein